MVESDESLAVNLYGEGKSLAKIIKEKNVKTINAISEKKVNVETRPKKRIQNRLLLKLDCCKNGWWLNETLATREENLRPLGL